MTIGYISLVILVLMGLLGTFLVGLRMARLYKDGLVSYKDAVDTGWTAFGLHAILWLALYSLVT